MLLPEASLPIGLSRSTRCPALTVLVPFIFVLKNFVRFGNDLELVLGGLASLINIGMILFGKLPVTFLDLLERCVYFNAKNFVIVFVSCPRHGP
jgi:hypothetical protein